MNDPSQIDYHKDVFEKGVSSSWIMLIVDNHYQTRCPNCPWTSGLSKLKGTVIIAYYKHLEYIWQRSRKD